MKIFSLNLISAFCLTTAIAINFHSEAAAQSGEIEVNVNGDFSPEGSVGLIIVDGKVIQKPVIKQDSINDETILATIASPKDVERGLIASAVLFGPDGQTAFADVKNISDAASAKSFYSLPECKISAKIAQETRDDLGYLQRLAEFRSARREGLQLLVTKKLDPQILEKIRRLEKGFGFQYSNKLSADTNAFELVNRLSRLANAIKNYQNSPKTK